MLTLTSSARGPRTVFACLPSDDVLEHVRSVLEAESVLTEPELARARAFARPDQRADFVAARLLTRLLLQRWRSPGADVASIAELVLHQACAACGGPHGRPADVLGLAVSWAHAGGFVAAAVGVGSVGVDVEPIVSGQDGRPDGPTSLRAWVRAEAIVKWGHGTLDEALTWRPLLGGRVAPNGQRYALDGAGRPHRSRSVRPRVPGLVITDASGTVDGAVCSVAGLHPARWVNPLR